MGDGRDALDTGVREDGSILLLWLFEYARSTRKLTATARRLVTVTVRQEARGSGPGRYGRAMVCSGRDERGAIPIYDAEWTDLAFTSILPLPARQSAP